MKAKSVDTFNRYAVFVVFIPAFIFYGFSAGLKINARSKTLIAISAVLGMAGFCLIYYMTFGLLRDEMFVEMARMIYRFSRRLFFGVF